MRRRRFSIWRACAIDVVREYAPAEWRRQRAEAWRAMPLPLRLAHAGATLAALALVLVLVLVGLAVACAVSTRPTHRPEPPPRVIRTFHPSPRPGQVARVKLTVPSPSRGRPASRAAAYILPPAQPGSRMRCGVERPRYMDDDSGDPGYIAETCP